MNSLARYVTISVKVPTELRDRMRELGIKASELLRRAIEEEVKRREIERIKEALKEMKPILQTVSIEEIVRSIREDRESR
ncbi:MAG: hypothetical protein QXO94_07580 [Candidatus Bathyarchaeia archaeon]